jgi:hypothetical protein
MFSTSEKFRGVLCLLGAWVLVVCDALIYLVGLSGSGCRQIHPARLTSFVFVVDPTDSGTTMVIP